MEVLYASCCGIDVHAKMLVACLIKSGQKETRTFETLTDDLLRLLDWLVAEGCTHVAIESTGVYWRPVFNILEGSVEVMLVNARDAKGFKARKTDVIDAEWLADLLRHGLLKASFIPPLQIRELRELTRYRESLVREQTALSNRIQKLIESGNIKLGQVVSDALGVSGKQMLRALAAGEQDAVKMSEMARRRMKRKVPELRRALTGRLTSSQRWVLRELLDQYEQVEAAISRVEEKIGEEIEQASDPFVGEAVKLLDTIPGIAERVAQTIVSEIGVEMKRFPTDKHLASWAAMCPGNNESAGKRKSGKTRKGNRYLRAALVQAAWAASHQKATYLAAQYQRLVKRMGKKKALVAVGHSILVIVYHVLESKASYTELGGDYFDRHDMQKRRLRLIHQLESLGLKVTVEELAQAA
ncbi:MAG TPA: IS110 family transposase [Pyrinomonadaceae bacterium]|jgi:transposase|nr:IS110 family transposase [Pyrinomonadaceae bacterium]